MKRDPIASAATAAGPAATASAGTAAPLSALWQAWWGPGASPPAPEALDAALRAGLAAPAPADAPLLALARRFGFGDVDCVLAAIAAWSESGIAAPTLADGARLLHAAGWRATSDALPLAAGALAASGWLDEAPGAPLALQPLRLARPLALALLGDPAPAAGFAERWATLPLPPSWLSLAREVAARLAHPPRRPQALVLRHLPLQAHGRAEATSWLVAVARQLGQRVVAAPAGGAPPPRWLAAWLELTHSLWLVEPVAADAAVELPALAGAAAPLLVLAHPQQTVGAPDRELVECRLPEPAADERAAVWRWALDRHAGLADAAAAPLAQRLAAGHRIGPGAICQVAALAASQAHAAGGAAAGPAAAKPCATGAGSAAGGAGREPDALLHATRQALPALGRGLVQDLGQWLDLPPAPPTLVLPPAPARQLDLLEARCRQRDRLPARLSETARARLGRGVKALLHGPPGTGKTLAAEWLAARLGKPLLRVDTAAVLSKYIGETERNLDRVMAAAEACDAVLLFDEADALFARRTEVGNANDRYANAQTSFLLQRLETAEGITVLTSNSRQRFDDAFTRRLDQIVEFTAPTPAERLRLWDALLGAASPLTAAERQRLAVDFEAAGGALRNALVSATVLADGRVPGWPELAVAVALECAKAQRPAPPWAQSAWQRWAAASDGAAAADRGDLGAAP